MIVVGIGCRSGVRAAEVDAAIDAALLRAQVAREAVSLIAVPAARASESGIIAAAAARRVTLISIAQDDLMSANDRTCTRSIRAWAAMNVHSVAEAAALAGAGPTARLLVPRVAFGAVTCALAEQGVLS